MSKGRQKLKRLLENANAAQDVTTMRLALALAAAGLTVVEGREKASETVYRLADAMAVSPSWGVLEPDG